MLDGDVFVHDLSMTVLVDNPSDLRFHENTFSFRWHHPRRTFHLRELKTIDGHPFSLIALDTYSAAIFEAFRQRPDELYNAILALQKGVRSGIAIDLATQTLLATTDIAAETLETDSEAEETK